jgi:uncharacterized damage-inducible protein DinB
MASIGHRTGLFDVMRPLELILQHVVNHSTYHRGQVTTLLRQIGVPAVPTDFLVFIDQRAGSG